MTQTYPLHMKFQNSDVAILTGVMRSTCPKGSVGVGIGNVANITVNIPRSLLPVMV